MGLATYQNGQSAAYGDQKSLPYLTKPPGFVTRVVMACPSPQTNRGDHMEYLMSISMERHTNAFVSCKPDNSVL